MSKIILTLELRVDIATAAWLIPPPPNSRELLPTFRTNCPGGSQFAQIGSHLAQNTTTNRCSLLSSHKPLLGYLLTQNTHNLTPNTSFPGLNLKVGKMNYSLGKMDPNWAKCLKMGQNFSRCGPKKKIITFFLKQAGSSSQQLQKTWKHSVFVLACQFSQSCTGGSPKSSVIDFAVKTFY